MAELGTDRLERGRRGILFVLAALIVWTVLRWGAFVYVDALWHSAVGYSDVFWKRTMWRWGLRSAGAVVVAVVVWSNMRIVASTLETIRIRRRFANIEIAEQLPRGYVNGALVLISGLMGLWFSSALTGDMSDRVLLYLSSQPWGAVDPVFGVDLSYYIFLLPLLSSAVAILLVLMFLTMALCVAGYAATGGLRWAREGLEMGGRTRVHLTSLIAVLLLLTAVRFFLARHLLLVDGNSAVQGIFGLTDHQARIPAYQGLAVVSLAAAFGVAWGGFRNRAVPVFVGVAAVVFGGIVVGEIYPAAIQRFRVVPNELVRESSYIDWNLQATRAAFGLSDLERQDFQVSDLPEPTPTEIMAQFDGLPVWTPDALLTTLKSLEARFPYYEFPSLAIDRYPTPSGVLPVALAVREVAPDQITESTWVTEHLRERFLAGQGAAAADATTRTPEGRPEMLLSGIPPEVTARGAAASGLALTRPQVFISGAPQDYAVITPADSAFESPEGGPGVPGVDYPRGISIGSALRRIALAWRFRELNLLVSTEVTDQSRLVFRRQAVERVLTLAPFLRALEGAYPIVHDGRVVWMVEGFTLSSTYPLASALGAGASLGRTRYVRNSVKATVDAVTGEVVLYRTDDSDPIIDAYSRAFPSLFRPLAEMPEGLLEHIRYPAILLDAQARVLAQYHQETAAVFYGQQDVWSLAQEQSRNDLLGEYPPAYGLYRLPGDEEEGFHLTTVFVPKDRPNLTALLVARSDPERYGELLLLDIPVESQVPGPRQVEALVDQDPDISQQLSLWRQGGSQVWLGHLHVIPVGDRFLYMEPVFLAASGDAIPELRRFVVSDGRRVAMRDGLGAAVAALWGGELPGGGDLLPTEGTDPGTPAIAGSVDDALSLLEEAEARLREGDWAGYGVVLDRLRILLERLAGG